MSLSQEFQNFIAQLRANPVPFEQLTDIGELRGAFNALGSDLPPLLDVLFRQVDAAGVPAEWVDPAGSDPSRVIFYLHGGGYVAGDPIIYRNFVTALCRASDCRALIVDYRLAPESPFPAALEDAQRSYAWLLTQGISADQIVIIGDSAGGGLALSTLVSLRDSCQPLPGAAVLLSPWTDLTLESESHLTKVKDDPIITHKFLDQSRQRYIGTGASDTDALVSPLHADLTGLPPLLVLVGTAEVLLDDSTALAHKAREAGVDVDLIEGDGMIHTWPFFIDSFPEAEKAVQSIGTFIHSRIR
ncbi:putative acetyl-hydrolase [Pectobacterium atrosepticum SCRI1043]|uniref:Acetyl-hydrolase n=1 Tax=Pectobacterium atrosepticum (strain SCRI 1043 / ATCC BAA-672) TaxID=218491 RepID=Q6D6T8_PECAS|nr:alpha/beta hydrolase [Pectobacterium atrosepticum]MCL6316366.1 alpha/beta hydrolase [Pectobacterium atrosepticum]MCL6319398.1 alpha/beta hydrolase [Pectobacterium atrosepticum]CAG74497.1 putative acetyl-hydrolase [Pectobacterium atrosepticum SCRI1043]